MTKVTNTLYVVRVAGEATDAGHINKNVYKALLSVARTESFL